MNGSSQSKQQRLEEFHQTANMDTATAAAKTNQAPDFNAVRYAPASSPWLSCAPTGGSYGNTMLPSYQENDHALESNRQSIVSNDSSAASSSSSDGTEESETMVNDRNGIVTTQRTNRRTGPFTSKGYKRHFDEHDYHDFALATSEQITEHFAHQDVGKVEKAKLAALSHFQKQPVRGGVKTPFPLVLHRMLEEAATLGHDSIVSWQPHGRAFLIHNPKAFSSQLLPTYFKHSKISSFQRQLSLYGFTRLTRSSTPDRGAYYNELFLRGRPLLCGYLQRIRVKGTWVRKSSSPQSEPNFYMMDPVLDPVSSTATATHEVQQQEPPSDELSPVSAPVAAAAPSQPTKPYIHEAKTNITSPCFDDAADMALIELEAQSLTQIALRLQKKVAAAENPGRQPSGHTVTPDAEQQQQSYPHCPSSIAATAQLPSGSAGGSSFEPYTWCDFLPVQGQPSQPILVAQQQSQNVHLERQPAYSTSRYFENGDSSKTQDDTLVDALDFALDAMMEEPTTNKTMADICDSTINAEDVCPVNNDPTALRDFQNYGMGLLDMDPIPFEI